MTPDGDQSRFPIDDSLCEACGYPLRGLAFNDSCPECGRPVATSAPARRRGLPWQNGGGLVAWLKTIWMTSRHPAASFDVLRLDRPGQGRGSANRDRFYLISCAGMVGVFWLGVWVVAGLDRPAVWGLGATIGVLVLTYIEVLGVAWFSRRRGWSRVDWRLAERVACYSAVGWLPAGVILAKASLLGRDGTLERWWPDPWGPWTLRTEVCILTLVGGAAVMWFETLVWLGIRRVRYANYDSTPGQTRRPGDSNGS